MHTTHLRLTQKINCTLPICRGVHSVDRVNFGRVSFDSVVFRIGYFWLCVTQRVTLGLIRLVTVRLEIGYSSYHVGIGLVSLEVRVKCQLVLGCHQLLIGSVFRVQIRFGLFLKKTEFGYILLITIDLINIKLSC